MREVITTVYVAEDGMEFNTQVSCLDYENSLQKSEAVDAQMAKSAPYLETLSAGRVRERVRNDLRLFFEWEYGG